ncbi:hypothetical protein R6Q57_014660 [Mikania cordata]
MLFYDNILKWQQCVLKELGPDVGALAKASGLRAIGYQMQEVYLKGFARNVNKATELLESIGKLEYAASCFCDLGDFKRVGTIFFVIIVWFFCCDPFYLTTNPY